MYNYDFCMCRIYAITFFGKYQRESIGNRDPTVVTIKTDPCIVPIHIYMNTENTNHGGLVLLWELCQYLGVY